MAARSLPAPRTGSPPPARRPGKRAKGRYEPRRPESTVLYQVFQGHLETFLAASQDLQSGTSLPRFVERELKKFLECGILAHGFARVRCRDCGDSLLVAFSCKGRAFCPSCGSRRMASLAADLVDHVLPRVPVRHWVFSLPFNLRYLVAFRPEARELVLSTFIEGVFSWMRDRMRLPRGVRAQGGSVTIMARAGGALNLNPHFHALILDGMFVEDPARREPRFVRMRHASEKDLRALEVSLAFRVFEALRDRGLVGDEGWFLPDLDSDAEGTLPAIHSASIQNRIAVGSRSGACVETEEGLAPEALAGPADSRGRNQAAHGFSLFVGRAISPRRRLALERLCRYVARPALSAERLEWTPDGKVRYRLAHPRSDGTAAVIFEPIELIEKLAALVPRPRSHVVRYHGVLAPNARWRSLVTPAPASTQARRPRPRTAKFPGTMGTRWIPWAELLKRVFAIDVLRCDACGGRREVIAFLTEPDVVRAFLECVGLPAEAPPIAPARQIEIDVA